MSRYARTIECYDCLQQVSDIQVHRKTCPKSCKNNTLLTNDKQSTSVPAKFANNTDYYAIIDTSGSMTGPRIDNAKHVLTNIIANLPEADRIAIITFDTIPCFRLKPRPVGQIRRQNELQSLLSRFKTQGLTSTWDAILMAVENLRDKNRKTVLNVLTDGDDNSSKNTYSQMLELISTYPNIKLNIIHISTTPNQQYEAICNGRGTYRVIHETELSITMSNVFDIKIRHHPMTLTHQSQ